MRRTRVAVREPFCPLGCKKPSGAICRVGSGGCAECVKFNALNVQQQGATSARLIELEDEAFRISSSTSIPTPNSPSKSVHDLVASARDIMTSIAHQRKSGFGSSFKVPEDSLATFVMVAQCKTATVSGV